jgi:hypothetical protein
VGSGLGRGERLDPAGNFKAVSSDAPYGDEDAHFWGWVLTGLLAAVVVGVVISLLVAFL